jgi:transcriptional regulator with XRE-family HTH domain
MIASQTMAIVEGFGQRLRAARIAAGLTQRELSRRIGVSRPHLSHAESGTWGVTLTALCALCRELNVTADFLLGLSSRKEEP